MKRTLVLALLATLVGATRAQATVEKKFTYVGQDAYAYFLTTSADGCLNTGISVLSHDIKQKIAADHGMDHVVDIFSVVTVDIGDFCTGNVLFTAYSDSTPAESTHTLVFDPQHDAVTLHGRFIMQDDGSFTFYWATIDLTWSISQQSTSFNFKDYVDIGDGVTFIRLRGKGEKRPTVAHGTLSIVPYFPNITVPAIGSGVSFALDSSTTPPQYSDFNFYFSQKQSDRIIYREHFYQGHP